MARFLKTAGIFLIAFCLVSPVVSAYVKKKCSFKGRRTDAVGSISEFTFTAEYIVREGPDSFTGKVVFYTSTPGNPKFKQTAAVEGNAAKGTWTIHLIYDLSGLKETWTGSGTFDKKTGKITVKGTGTGEGGADTQRNYTFEMSGEGK